MRRSRPAGIVWTREKLFRAIVSAFIAFHLVAILAWSAPFDTAFLNRSRAMIRPYMVWSGLFQSWRMFSKLRRINDYLTANITYRDGTATTWTFPRPENMGYMEKLFRERYRTFANDYLREDPQAGLWPDAARYIARLNSLPDNPVIKVELVRNWSDIPPPDPDRPYQPGPWRRYTFFSYKVASGDLQ